MKIYRTNGEIVELNTAEYRELFIENAPVGCGGMGLGHCARPVALAEAVKEEAEEEPEPVPAEPKPEPPKPNPSDLLEPEPSAGGKNKKKLDDGKIAALRRAGWTFEKIADEMGCSAQTALNHYNAYIKSIGR